MRIIMFILSLAVCFLVGVLYGTGQERGTTDDGTDDSLPITQTEEKVIADIPEEAVEVSVPLQSVETPAYKAASALETIVNFFYEVVVGVLYQLSRLFY